MTTDAMKKKLAQMVAKDGLLETARKFGIGKEAIARYLGGVPVREGSRVLIEQSITKKSAVKS